MNTPDTAICIECGEDKPVCNDSGYTELPDGTIQHDDPVCYECTRANRIPWDFEDMLDHDMSMNG